jgi:putative membrane protein insertion efficiency factor
MREKIQQISREEESGEKTVMGVVSPVKGRNFTRTPVDDTSTKNCCPQAAGSRETTETTADKGRVAQRILNFLSPKTALIAIVRLYQACISPWFPPCCRFHPTCSSYAREALEIHGFFKGLLLSIWRVLRCHPFCKGGYDPVPSSVKTRIHGTVELKKKVKYSEV